MSPSELVPYQVADFTFDDITDNLARHDTTTQGTTIRPRLEEVAPSARERFKKTDPHKPRPTIRIDLTDRPRTFTDATQNIQERASTRDLGPQTKAVARDLSRTYHHFDRFRIPGRRL